MFLHKLKLLFTHSVPIMVWYKRKAIASTNNCFIQHYETTWKSVKMWALSGISANSKWAFKELNNQTKLVNINFKKYWLCTINSFCKPTLYMHIFVSVNWFSLGQNDLPYKYFFLVHIHTCIHAEHTQTYLAAVLFQHSSCKNNQSQ